MKLKNNSKRLITLRGINSENGKEVNFNLMPAGKSVFVSDDVAESKFAKTLLASGDISVGLDLDSVDLDSVDLDSVDLDSVDLDSLTKGQLIDYADAQGIEVSATDKKLEILNVVKSELENRALG